MPGAEAIVRKRMLIRTSLILVLVLSAFAAIGRAQNNPAPNTPDASGAAPSPDAPGVARVSFVRGDVSMQRGDSGETSAVDLNTPLEPGDKLMTGPRSRAELQLDFANILRLDENAGATIATLQGNSIQIQLSQGLAEYSLIQGTEASAEIDTPNVAVIPRRVGLYRIEVTASGDTLVTVREGDADIATPDGSTPLHKGQMATVRGAGNEVRYQISAATSNDEFDRFSMSRDQQIASSASNDRYANQYYTGASDLDSYGSWDNVPDYGWVWAPRVVIGWAPYRHGRWAWEPYWGWTWVSYEPWGWAPYHYGRWFIHGASWVWWPGPVTRQYRPVYAPAYVSFFGFGSHGGLRVGMAFGGFSSIGWMPAGPGDFVNPWWGVHRNEFNVVNVTNITNVYNVRNVNVIAPLRPGDRASNVNGMLANNQIRYSVSAVSAENFGHGRADVHTISAMELRDGHFMTGNVPVVPTRESLRISDRTIATNASQQTAEPHFFSRRAPASAAQRESFANESAQVQQAIGPFNQAAGGRGVENRPGGAPANGNGTASALSYQRQEPSARPGNTAETGAWRLFSQDQGAREQVQPQSTAPASPRVYSQRVTPQAPVSAQSAPQTPPPASPTGQNGWQRFSGPPRTTNGFRGGEVPPENRPQLQLNRPIIQPRSIPGPNNYQYQQPYVPEPQRAPEPRTAPPSAPNYSRPASSGPGPEGNGNYGGAPRSGGFSGNGGGQARGGSGGGNARSSSGHAQGHR
jgi:hypothetical protein